MHAGVVPRRRAGDKRAYERVETEPGLDHYINDPKGQQITVHEKTEIPVVCITECTAADLFMLLSLRKKKSPCMCKQETLCPRGVILAFLTFERHRGPLNPSAGLVEAALSPLLDWAEEVVPESRWESTPVFLFATAGLRKLPLEHQENILGTLRHILANSRFR